MRRLASSTGSSSRSLVVIMPSTRQEPQRPKIPRARGVVFQEEAVHVRALKQSFGDRVVPTARLPMAGVAPA